MPLLVLEGLDGAGKSTQIHRLQQVRRLARGIGDEYLHFPRFDAPVYGELIARFLRGELGGVDRVDPYIVALLYAGDRADAAAAIRGWLAEGKSVILDRYVYSNVAYQCAKVADPQARRKLRDWIVDLEYRHHAIPVPDLSLFLDVPFGFTKRKLEEVREGDDREYLQGKKDIHESSLTLQQRVREVYLEQETLDDRFRVIDCSVSRRLDARSRLDFRADRPAGGSDAPITRRETIARDAEAGLACRRRAVGSTVALRRVVSHVLSGSYRMRV